MARRFTLVSVPSHPDGNPEHRHFLPMPRLTEMLREAGAVRIQWHHVPEHTIALARSPRR